MSLEKTVGKFKETDEGTIYTKCGKQINDATLKAIFGHLLFGSSMEQVRQQYNLRRSTMREIVLQFKAWLEGK